MKAYWRDKRTRTRQAFFGLERVKDREKKGCVLTQFDSVAGKYDMMNTILSFGIHHLWKRTAVRMLEIKACDRVLDLCGGTGDLSVLAARKLFHAKNLVLCDISYNMMDAGRRKRSNSRLRRCILYVQGDAEALAFKDDSFDVAMVAFGIRNLTHIKKGFAEMYRVLKPGGRMVCLEFSRPTNRFFRALYDVYSFLIMPALGEWLAGSKKAYSYLPESIRLFPLPDELNGILEEIGFSDIRYKKLTNGIAVVHAALKVIPVPSTGDNR